MAPFRRSGALARPLLGALLALGACRRPPGPPARGAGNEAPGGDSRTALVEVPAPTTSEGSLGGVPPDPIAPQATSREVPVDDDDAVWGSPTALVTLVEFTDFECPFCARAQPVINELRKRYGPAKLRVVFKHRPLPFHKTARPAARVGQAVTALYGSDAFFRYADDAFAHQRQLDEEGLRAALQRLGFDAERVLVVAATPDIDGAVDTDNTLAERIGATGTPNFRINGLPLRGAQPIAEFVRVIDAELAATVALIDAGVPHDALYQSRVAVNHSTTVSEAAPAVDSTVWAVPAAGAPALGPKDALVTIVAFVDYESPFCKAALESIETLMRRDPTDLRLVLRQRPQASNPRAQAAARLAVEAQKQRGDAAFFAVSRALCGDATQLHDETLWRIATANGLHLGRAKRAVTTKVHDAEIERQGEAADDFGARGAPVFYVNGRYVDRVLPLQGFTEVVDERLAAARAAVAGGTPRTRAYEELVLKAGSQPKLPDTKVVTIPADAPSKGPLGAPVVVQVFADFQCPFCKRVEPTLDDLDRAFPGKLRFVWRNLPLPFHQSARPAAIAALEARAQRGDAAFWRMHDLLFKGQGTPGGLEHDGFVAYASALGLDAQRFEAALGDGRHDARIAVDEAAASAAGIRGTPTFLVNQFVVTGAQQLGAFKRVVRLALARKP